MMLPFASDKEHRWRWMQGKGEALHRVYKFKTRDNDVPGVEVAETVCGRKFKRLVMPGVFSRFGAARCKRCCERLGLPAGHGIPANMKIEEPRFVGD